MDAASPPDFPMLFREYAPFVWRVLKRYGVAERDLADLCQEVFIVVLRKLPEFRAEASLRTWIYAIAARVASGHRRLSRTHREQEHAPAALPLQIDERTPEDAAQAQDALFILEQALGQVSEEQREAFMLFEFEELSVQEVADALGCPRGTAFSRILSARAAIEAQLRRALAREKSFLTSRAAGVST